MPHSIGERAGQQLGSYCLLRLLGQGEFADVYLAEHVYLKTQAAVKVLHMQLRGGELEAFLAEARTLAHLVHPHVVRVLDFGVEEDTPFLVMDYAPDGTLRHLHPRGTQLPSTSVLRYVSQVAEALEYAHYHHVIHRDVKPDNMLLGRNNDILLSDFGLAIVSQLTSQHDSAGAVGTCNYGAPEQFIGKPCAASDQYALGVVAYEWLTGNPPFHGSPLEQVARHQSAQPPPLHFGNPGISPGIEQVVLRALAKDPAARWPSVQAFADALRQASAGEGAYVPVLWASAAHFSFQFGRAHRVPLIGREEEWDALSHLLLSMEEIPTPPPPSERGTALSLTSPQGNGPHCTMLVGEPGIGKTRLAEDLCREAQRRGWAIAWSRGYSHQGNAPYLIWAEALRNLLATGAWLVQTQQEHNGALPSPLRRFLPEYSSSEQPDGLSYSALPEQERLDLWEAMRQVLARIAERAPLLVVLDDLHWADESSLELLAYLLRHMTASRILFVGTFRHNELTQAHPLHALENALRYERHVTRLHLKPLSREHIGKLVSHFSLTHVEEVQDRAGGNPFFAEELARAWKVERAQRARQSQPATDSWSPLPDTITAALERRVSGLSAGCQELLSTAAVLGGSFTYTALCDMVSADQEEDRVLDRLEEGLKAGILSEESARGSIVYHFWHPLVANYLYEHLSAARRVSLHRMAARTLLRFYQGREGEGAAAIVSHLIESGSSPTSIARYAEMAGNHAYALSAFPQAARQYRLALQHLEEVPLATQKDGERPDEHLHLAGLCERLGECLVNQGTYAEARHCFERVIALRATLREQDPPAELQREALLWTEIGRAFRMTGEYSEATRCCGRAETILMEAGGRHGQALANLRLQQSYIDWQEGRYAIARARATEALRLIEAIPADPQGWPTPPLPTRVDRLLGWDPLLPGEVHEALSTIAGSEGRSAESLSHLQTALGIYEQRGCTKAIAHATGNLGFLYLLRGEDALASEQLTRSLELAGKVGDLPVQSVAALNLGELFARAGALPEAEALFRQCLALTRQVGDRETEIWASDSLAAAYRDQGKLFDALECIARALELARSLRNVQCLGLVYVALAHARLAQAVAATGETDQAALLMRAGRAIRRALALERLYPEPRAAGHLALAQIAFLLGDPETAEQQTSCALEEAQASDLLLIQVRAQRLRATLLASQGAVEQADALFEQVLQTCRARHMRLEEARTLLSQGEALLDRCDPFNTSCMIPYEQAVERLHEARRTFADCHATLDYQRAERVLARSAEKKPYLLFF